MKTPTRLLLILLLSSIGFGGLCSAEPDDSATKPSADAQPHQHKPLRGNESRLLLHFLSMEADELAKLRQTIERIEKMSPEEKDGLRRRMKDLNSMDPGKIDAARKRFQSIPKETRETMRQRWDSMTAEERAEWHRRLRELSHTDRLRIFEEEGFLPGGRPHGKPGDVSGGRKTPPPPPSGN